MSISATQKDVAELHLSGCLLYFKRCHSESPLLLVLGTKHL